MSKLFFAAAAIAIVVPGMAVGQTWKPPAASQRYPSKWGAADERGSANHQTPAAVLKAARLIKTGEVIELGHVLSPSGPFVGARLGLDRRTGGDPLSQ